MDDSFLHNFEITWGDSCWLEERKKTKWYGEDTPNMEDNEAWNKWRKTEQNTGK